MKEIEPNVVKRSLFYFCVDKTNTYECMKNMEISSIAVTCGCYIIVTLTQKKQTAVLKSRMTMLICMCNQI